MVELNDLKSPFQPESFHDSSSGFSATRAATSSYFTRNWHM